MTNNFPHRAPFQGRRHAAAALLFILAASCSRNSGLPAPGSPQYSQAVSAFYVGLAGLQTGVDELAKEKLTLASQVAPGEPSSWANLAVLSLRQQDFEGAYKNAEQARSLKPDSSRIEHLLGIIESKRGKQAEAIAHLKKAAETDPKNLKALVALAEETERQGGDTSAADAQRIFARVAGQRPANIAAWIEVARVAAKAGDSAALQNAAGKLAAASASWPEEAKAPLETLKQAASGGNPRAAALQVVYLRNTLVRAAQYRQDLDEIKTPVLLVGEPFTSFLKLATPTAEPAAADAGLKFEPATAVWAGSPAAGWAAAIMLDDQGKPSILWTDAAGAQTTAGAKIPLPKPKNPAMLGIDLNYDFKMDLIFAGPDGVRIFEQKDPKTFKDITASTKIPANIQNGAYTGAWAVDYDLDGDLDVLLGVSGGDPLVLRNNGDQTFAVLKPFRGAASLRAFAAADIDGDGDPDFAMIDGDGKLQVLANDRLGQYRARALPAGAGKFVAAIAADVNSDGAIDFVALREDGSVIRLSDKDAGANWDTAEVVKATKATPSLLAADLDNNGAIDLIVGDGEIFLGGAKGFTKLPSSAGLSATAAADLDGDGRVDLVGRSLDASRPGWTAMLNRGTKNYGWHNIRVRAAKANGDQRINSFGMGGDIEVRAGLLMQKQVITSPLMHFGIGEHAKADIARIIWPNGVAQAEFELKPNEEILSVQRLKGSCPWLFAWDGTKMSFVKDGAPWSPALGLHINAQVVAGIGQTEEWFKISGESLKPRDGIYDLRITNELWETYYVDHYSLLVVDHPAGTAIYTDERFAVPSPPLKIFTTSDPQPFAGARDDQGADVSAVVRDLDQKYLDNFGRGPYQGLTRDHWVELELPESAPASGPLYLLASGWVHPTDATVNIAIGQNSIPQPQGLSIEVPDAKGRWVSARKGLGFPAGKMKTAVLDLTGIFRAGAPRKLRLRTNLEVFWDKLEWAAGTADQNRVTRLELSGAELRYRGYSFVKAADPSSPELPDYQRLMSTGQIWHDLEGYSTRHGDVRELLQKIDDRMVIMNAGDEVRLQFAAPPPPPAGWKRDYVMVGDGWIKDGDFNSTYSKTVLPLPYHGMKNYDVPPGRLEEERAYKLHPADWQNFHTRYVTPDAFERALRN